MVRSSFSILFFIRESKVRKNGNAPIEVIITINGEKCSFPTGKQVHIDKWDKTKQQVKGKDEEAKSLNNYLKAVKAKLYQKEVFDWARKKKHIRYFNKQKKTPVTITITGVYIFRNNLNYFFIASSIATATATVAPTIGLLPIPRNPIIST